MTTEPATEALPVRFPGAHGEITVKTFAAALRGRHILVNEADLFLQAGDGVWQVTPAHPDDLAVQLLAAIGADLADLTDPEPGSPQHLRRQLGIAQSALRDIAMGGAVIDGKMRPIRDPSVYADKALTALTGIAATDLPANSDLRDGVRVLLADVTASANATRPSKKTQLEDDFVIALRKLLGDQ